MNHIKNQEKNILQEQRYAIVLLYCTQVVDMVMGLARQILIDLDDYHGATCNSMQTYFKFSFNWHVMLLLFYLVFFHKGLIDPLG